MNKLLTILFFSIISLGYAQERDFKNQGEQEDYWAKQVFENGYEKQDYPIYKSKIIVESNYQILFGDKTLKLNCSPEYLPIFTNGIFYPQLIIGNGENNKILTSEELQKLTLEEQIFSKLSRNDYFNISNLEELTFLNPDFKTKRFRFWSFQLGMANPNVFYFELTNKKGNKKMSIEKFIKNSKLTFIKKGYVIL